MTLLSVCQAEGCVLYFCTLQVHEKVRLGLLQQETQIKIISVFACSSLSKLQVVRPSKDTWCLCGRVVKITQPCICYLPCCLDLPSCYCKVSVKTKRPGMTHIFCQAIVRTEMTSTLSQIKIYCCKSDGTATSQLIVTELSYIYN